MSTPKQLTPEQREELVHRVLEYGTEGVNGGRDYLAQLQGISTKRIQRLVEAAQVEVARRFAFDCETAKERILGTLNGMLRDSRVSDKDKLKAMDIVLKVHGLYAPVRQQTSVTMDAGPTVPEALKALLEQPHGLESQLLLDEQHLA